MNRSGMREQTWRYRPDNAQPYWIVAAPSGTKPNELDTIDIPDSVRPAARNCVNYGEATVILAEATRCDCVRPVGVPEIRDLHSVRKGSGEATVFILHKGEGNPGLAAIE